MRGSSEIRRVSRPSRAELLAWAARQDSLDQVPVRSRDSSASSSNREVRCGCQFYQTDSLLPERVSLVGRPHTRRMATQIGDHEYEPVAPPPSLLRVSDVEMELGVPRGRGGSEASSTSGERRFLRIPLDAELVIPPNGDEEDEIMDSEEIRANAEMLSTREMQNQMEERYFTQSPATGSRTDADITTSQVDSSALEDLPLQRGARTTAQPQVQAENRIPQSRHKAAATAAAQATTRGIQRIRTQADKIKTKFRSIQMPARPNITFPERPKFTMPERPKITLPDRPKFKMPERPKFNFPERPKFNFPDRPKFNMPERPKFTMPSFTLPRPHMPRSRRPLKERQNEEPGVPSSSKKIFDFDFKTYPRIFDRKARHGTSYVTSSPKLSRAKRSQTPPPRPEAPKRPKLPPRKKGPVGQRWVHRFTDIKYADDENNHVDAEEDFEDEEDRAVSGLTESTTAFQDKDYGYAVNLGDGGLVVGGIRRGGFRQDVGAVGSSSSQIESGADSDREQQSSGSSRRRGVLEEIDSDEFFLREKGISQEDVNVGRFLSSEIREAFRPPVNALADMDNDLGNQYRSTPERSPTRPVRNRIRPRKPRPRSKFSRRPPTPPFTPPEQETDYFNTYPPTRPNRMRRVPRNVPYYDQVAEETGVGLVNGYDVPPDDNEELEFRLPDDTENAIAEEAPQIQEPNELEGFSPDDFDRTPPSPPKRAKRPRKYGISTWGGRSYKDEWIREIETQIVPVEESEQRVEPEYIVPTSSGDGYLDVQPVPPKRAKRTRSPQPSGTDPSQELFIDAEEDRTSRGADSLPSESLVSEGDMLDGDQPDPGYASVNKPAEKPKRQKPPRPPVPTLRTRRKKSTRSPGPITAGYSYFFTLPKRTPRTYYITPPTRPLRTYSTLKPRRPPRRDRMREDQAVETSQQAEDKRHPYGEIEELDTLVVPIDEDRGYSPIDETHSSNRDLQSGIVIEKMKGRPLPAPPRPPRKTKKPEELGDDEYVEAIDGEEVVPSIADETPLQDSEQAALENPQSDPCGSLTIFGHQEDEARAALRDDIFYLNNNVTSPKTIESTESSGMDVPLPESSEVTSESQDRLQSVVQPEISLRNLDPILEDVGSSELIEELPVEVSVATQTDPLPDDLCVEAEEFETEEISEEPPRQGVDIGTFTAAQDVVEPVPPPPPVPERMVPVYVMPGPETIVELQASKLHVSELDVDCLNVTELQAQRIRVSDIDGMTLQLSELTSQSGHLVVTSIQPHPSLLQELSRSSPAHMTISSPTPSSEQSTEALINTSSPTATLNSNQAAPISGPHNSCSPSTAVQQTPPNDSAQHQTRIPVQESVTTPVTNISSTSIVSSNVVHESVAPATTGVSLQSSAPPNPHPATSSTEGLPAPVPNSAPTNPHNLSSAQPLLLTDSQVQQLIDAVHRERERSTSPPSLIPSNTDEVPADLQISKASTDPQTSKTPVDPKTSKVSVDPQSNKALLSIPAPSMTSDEEEEFCSCPSSPVVPRRPLDLANNDKSMIELSGQLVSACHGATLRAIRSLLNYMVGQLKSPEDEHQERTNLQLTLCILLVLVAGLILLGFGSNTTVYHHWDFFFPP